MSKELLNRYRERLDRFTREHEVLAKKDRAIALLRAAVFFVLIAFLIIFVRTNWLLGAVVPGALLLGLIWLVQISSRLKEQMNHLQQLARVNEDEILAVQGKLDPFKTGTEYQDYHHAYSYDLDLFGDHSLFRCIERTGTVPGKDQLAHDLLHLPADREVILNRQQAVQELSGLLDWRQHFLATGKQIAFEKDETKELKSWLLGKDYFSRKKLYPVLFVLVPLLAVGLPFLVAFGVLSYYYLLFYLFPLTLVLFEARRILQEQNRLGRFVKLFKKYSGLLLQIEQQEFLTDLLRDEQQSLIHKDLAASKIVNKLSGLLWGIETRNNLLMAFLLNAFWLWDLRYMIKLEQWRTDFGPAFENWLAVIGRIEVLNSLANLAFNRADLLIPELANEGLVFDMEEGGHLLLPPSVRVDNSMHFNGPGQIKIITGANMAGKSTLLRTAGTNLILAHLGAPVCAKKFTFTPVRIRTSVRTNDSLGDNESYFYAELVKLNRIMTELRENGPLFVIVDEMLRGTNSRDKHVGSVGLVQQLIEGGAIGLVATHDVELGKLKESYPDYIENKCFEVEIADGQLRFDYLLRDGISQNLNATFLMKQMGILKND